jgi:anti-sigma B factor antagonist
MSETTTPGPSAPAVTGLRLEGELTIYRAEELKPILLAALADANPLEIDLSGVTELDTAGVQLLLLIKKTAQVQQRELRLLRHRLAVTDVFERLNLVAFFDDPLVLATTTPPGRRV